MDEVISQPVQTSIKREFKSRSNYFQEYPQKYEYLIKHDPKQPLDCRI